MALPIRKRLPHAIPQWATDGSWFFITINTEPRDVDQLCRPDIAAAQLASMAHNHEKLVWHCRLCLLMPDHLHAILSVPRMPGLKVLVSNWKRFTAVKSKIKWQRDFFDHRLRTRGELEEKVSYVLLNPVRKGLCKDAEDWPWVYRPNDRVPPRLEV